MELRWSWSQLHVRWSPLELVGAGAKFTFVGTSWSSLELGANFMEVKMAHLKILGEPKKRCVT